MSYLLTIITALITLLVTGINLKWKDKTQSITRVLYIFASISFLIAVFSAYVAYKSAESAAKDREKREAVERYTGILKPEGVAVKSIEIGDSGTIFLNDDPQLSLLDVLFNNPSLPPRFREIREENNLAVSIDEGQLKVSARLRNRDGSLLAEVINNEWKINPNKAWDRNYSQNALEVKDETGDIVLQLKLVSGRIQFQGKFYSSSGFGIGFIKNSLGRGSGVVFKGLEDSRVPFDIEPIFKYPSSEHLGELR